MKLAVLADIHANLQALQTASEDIDRWRPDATIVLGDIINRGPRPLECWQFIKQKMLSSDWLVIKGNHEDYVIQHSHRTFYGSLADLHQVSGWTFNKLNSEIPEIERLPDMLLLLSPADTVIRAVHASMKHNRDGIYPETSDAELCEKIAPPPDLFLTGHTHRPLIRQLNSTLVVNAGSCGLPFDRDQRLAYARLTWQSGVWQAQIIRIPYDVEETLRDFTASGMDPEAGPLTKIMRVELGTAASHLANWSAQYASQVESGMLPITTSVDRYLSHIEQ